MWKANYTITKENIIVVDRARKITIILLFLCGVGWYLVSSSSCGGNGEQQPPPEALKASKLLLEKILIDSGTLVSVIGPVEPSTLLQEDVFLKGEKISNAAELEIPETSGTYYAFLIDGKPWAKFSHTVHYAWVRVEDGEVEIVDANYPFTVFRPEKKPSPSHLQAYEVIQGINFAFLAGEMGSEIVDTSHKPIASQGREEINFPQASLRRALVIDLGDYNQWRDLADNMADQADSIAQWLNEKGFDVKRRSQYWGNSHSYYTSIVHLLYDIENEVRKLASSTGTCHELFIYINAHGYSKKEAKDLGTPNSEAGLWFFDVSGNKDHPRVPIPYSDILQSIIDGLNTSAKKNPIKIILFVDSCFSGALITEHMNTLKNMCNMEIIRDCGLTTFTVVNDQQEAASGERRLEIWPWKTDSGTEDFLEGAKSDHDGDGKQGDIRDRFEEMKKQGGTDWTPQLFICSNQKNMCSLD